MYSRWFNVAIVMLWLSTMTWLVWQKVLPTLLVGEPPSYRTILAAQRREAPVGWGLRFDGRRLGWALSTTDKLPNDLTVVRSRVHFAELPLRDMAPDWLRALIRMIEKPSGSIQMDVESTLIIDPLGRLSRFESSVQLDPLDGRIRLIGTVEEEGELELEVRSGEFSYKTTAQLPPNALVGDSLSPQTQLPGLRVGQTWTVPAYSPLRPPNNPMEILVATVEGFDMVSYDGRAESTYLVVYRTDPGIRLGGSRAVRGRLWVRRDGTVLKQEVLFFDSAMTFVRLSEDEALELELSTLDEDN